MMLRLGVWHRLLVRNRAARDGRTTLQMAGLLCAALLAGCGGGLAPILNVDNAPVIAPGGMPPSQAYVRDAIMHALSARRWVIEQETPAGITASYHWSNNAATVHIQYDERTFSIQYVESTPGLHYNGTAIHRRYNQWVDRLRSEIRGQLTLAAIRGAPVVAAPPPSRAVAAPPPAAAPPPPAPPVATTTPAAPPSTYGNEAPPPPPPPPPPAANAPRK